VQNGDIRGAIQAVTCSCRFARESDAAKEIGVTREAIIQLETGKTKELKGSNAVLAAEAFGVTTDYLITGVEIEGSSEIVEIWLKLDGKRRALLLATAENLLSAQESPVKPTARNPYPAVPMPIQAKSPKASRK